LRRRSFGPCSFFDLEVNRQRVERLRACDRTALRGRRAGLLREVCSP
jgi:hypothetical protein